MIIRKTQFQRIIPEDVRRRNDLFHRSPVKNRKEIDKDELKKVCDYLENPTKIGIWTLRINLEPFLGISKDMKEELEDIFKTGEIEIPSTKKKIKLTKEEKDNLISSVNRLTFIFRVFSYLSYLEKDDESLETYSEIEDDANDKLILDILDLENLKKKYKEAFDFFKENIFFKGFSTLVTGSKVMKIKEGFFTFEEDEEPIEPEELRKISLVSLKYEVLNKLVDFYRKIGRIKEYELVLVFSPEEEIFKPYIKLLDRVYESLIDSSNMARLFERSISEYNDENFSNSISNSGLIAEHYFTQIYETLFRDTCPKSLTLGQIYDLINNKVTKEVGEKKLIEPESDFLYRSINSSIEQKNENVDNALKIIRDFLSYIKENNKYLIGSISKIQNKDEQISIFPEIIKLNINELIKNRNAISHLSRIPIGDYEALRTMYCCISLILWWNKQKKTIDWKKNREEIIKDLVKSNK